jgi:endonuclease/exonuclease/phosphatase (EEP) superfamily protein YafD
MKLFCYSAGHLILKVFWFSLWLVALSLLGVYLLRWWLGDRYIWLRVMSYFLPWFLVGLIPSVLLATIARRYFLSLTLALPVLLISFSYAPLFLPRLTPVLAGNKPFKVMSYNILYRNQQLEKATALIQSQQPDILLLQEVTPFAADTLSQGLLSLYPEHEPYYAYQPNMAQMIISRYPITPGEASVQKGRLQKVMIESPGGPIAVWNVHPPTPYRWRRQYQQISALAEDIAAVEGPLIVGGDFNTTDQSETYRLITQNLDNAHWEAGWGFGFSFPAHSPRVKGIPVIASLIRIDHIFYSRHFFAHRASTLDQSGGSDHFPVVAELSLVRLIND